MGVLRLCSRLNCHLSNVELLIKLRLGEDERNLIDSRRLSFRCSGFPCHAKCEIARRGVMFARQTRRALFSIPHVWK